VTVIRPLERSDLARAATLYDIGFRDGCHPADPAVARFLERTLIDDPCSDPELPSLLATDEEGRAIGFIGAGVRRMRLGERPVRLRITSHFAVDPQARQPLAGPQLIRHILDGPQDATVTDTATDTVRQMWLKLGGRMLYPQCIEWIRIFRPWRIAARLAARGRSATPQPLRWLAAALDVPTAAAARRYLRPAPAVPRIEPLTADAFLEALPVVTQGLDLFPDYDETFLDWLFNELPRVYRDGTVVRNLVLGNNGRPVGWYIYILRPESVSELLQLAATERGVEEVLDHLLFHADAHGSAALRGRLEPALVEPMARRRSILRYTGRALIHSRNADVLQAAAMGDALLTKLEGEWWGETFL
jgi:hypothetical protein